MNNLIFTDALPDSPQSWGSFTLAHGMDHDLLDAALRRAGHDVSFLPLYDFPAKDNGQYLLDHWQVHQSHASVLGIQLPADLSVADFTNPDTVADWLQLHASVHLAETQALGIT